MTQLTPEQLAESQAREMKLVGENLAAEWGFREVYDDWLDSTATSIVNERSGRAWAMPFSDLPLAELQFKRAFRHLHNNLRGAITTGRYEFRRHNAPKNNIDRPRYDYDVYDRGEHIACWIASSFSRSYMLFDRADSRVRYSSNPKDADHNRHPVRVETKANFVIAVVRYRDFIRSQEQIDADATAAAIKKAERRADEKAEDAKRSKEKRAERLYDALRGLYNHHNRKDVSEARELLREIDEEIARNEAAVGAGE